jgi:acylphosphatase
MALKQVQLFVRGRVQGVYFRASTQREARRLGLTGWVKNRPDGSVEIVAEGEEVSIRELYGWAQKGPSAARVDRVETRWASFRISESSIEWRRPRWRISVATRSVERPLGPPC